MKKAITGTIKTSLIFLIIIFISEMLSEISMRTIFLSFYENKFFKGTLRAFLYLIFTVPYYKNERKEMRNDIKNKISKEKLFFVVFMYGTFLLLKKFNRNLEPEDIWQLNTLSVVIIYPIIEEVVFRGFLFKKFNFKNQWITVIITSLLFAVYHEEFSFLRLLTLLVIGIYFGYLYMKTKNIILCIFAHALHNLTTYFGFGSYSDKMYYIFYIFIFFLHFLVLILVNHLTPIDIESKKLIKEPT